MADPARRRATYDDLRAVPAQFVAEILNGELYTSPPPSPPHARAASSLGGELYGPFDRGRGGPGGWIILIEPELHLHGDVLVPDIAAEYQIQVCTPVRSYGSPKGASGSTCLASDIEERRSFVFCPVPISAELPARPELRMANGCHAPSRLVPSWRALRPQSG
jgi:hypothetical protein